MIKFVKLSLRTIVLFSITDFFVYGSQDAAIQQNHTQSKMVAKINAIKSLQTSDHDQFIEPSPIEPSPIETSTSQFISVVPNKTNTAKVISKNFNDRNFYAFNNNQIINISNNDEK